MSIDPQHVCYGCFMEKEPGAVCPHCGFSENSERAYLAVPLGTILDGRYLIGKVLGIGGFGITYLGYDLTLDYKVAVKEYLPSGFATRSDDHYTLTVTSSSQQQAYDEGLDKFLSEARTLAKLHGTHNVVSVQDFFKENNTAYFVMEYVDGESLKDYLDKTGGRVSYEAASSILLPIMKALSEVHAHGVIHRDISPDNISITSTGEPKLLDFGAARSAYAESKSVSVILKHGLAPIEQYSNHGKLGPWTDVYAMGATFYRTITGILPPESVERIHADTIKTPSSLGIAIPQNAELALMKALAVNPENRFQNMQQFMDSLSGKTAIPAAPVQPVAPVAVPPVAPVQVQPQAMPVAAPQAPAYTAPQPAYQAPQPATAFGQGYAPAQPVTPVQTAPKKGMSKGAIVGIIVGAVALVLTVVGTIVAISITNNSAKKPKHTTTETTDDGGHFGSKESTDYTDYSESSSESSAYETPESSSRITDNGDPSNMEGGTVTNLSSLSASMWIPDGYKKNSNGFYQKGTSGFGIFFSEMVDDYPVYDLSSVEENKEVFLKHYLGKTVEETYAGKFTMPSGISAYEIDGKDDKNKYILVCVPAYNAGSKPGCYFLNAYYKTNDEGGKVVKAITSFVSTGDVKTKLSSFSQDFDSDTTDGNGSDVKMRYMFDQSLGSSAIMDSNSLWVVHNKNYTSKTVVMFMKVFSNKSEEQVRTESKNTFVKEFEKNSATLKTTKTSTVTYGPTQWTVDTHDFGNFTACSITATYPNGMVVCIHAKCINSAKATMNNYIKDLERSVRLY